MKPKYFSIDHFCEMATQLVQADEPLKALDFLDNFLPSYYREFPDPKVKALKDRIYSKMSNVVSYSWYSQENYDVANRREIEINRARLRAVGMDENLFNGLKDMIDIPFCYPRGPLVKEKVKELNEKGITPHIVEIGPAQYWLPHGLNKYKLNYTYHPLTLNLQALASQPIDLYKLATKGEFNILVCFEVIEHLYYEQDIYLQVKQYEASHGLKFDLIMISTPKHTFLGGQETLDREIEHVRTYSSRDLVNYGVKNWPEYKWNLYDHDMMVIVGEL